MIYRVPYLVHLVAPLPFIAQLLFLVRNLSEQARFISRHGLQLILRIKLFRKQLNIELKTRQTTNENLTCKILTVALSCACLSCEAA
jgi:hypothetical protein